MKTDPNAPAYPVSERRTENYMDSGGYGRTRDVTVNAGGLTKRELFAMYMPPLDPDCSCNYAGELVGLTPPTIDSARHDWPVFWRRANARYRVMQADALIAALNEEAER